MNGVYAYGQLRWQNHRLGLMMTNSCNQRFFLYMEKLQELTDDEGVVKEVKLRDRHPQRAVGYYPGQVVGKLSSSDQSVTITLIAGTPTENLELINNDLPEDYLARMIFIFPRSDFAILIAAGRLMLSQREVFDDRLSAAEATPLISPPRSSKSKRKAT